MKRAKFSSQPVRDFMKIGKLLKLTPLVEHLDGLNVEHVERKGNDISIPLSLEYKPFSDLIAQFEAIQQENPGFQLFNEKLVDGGYIKIPREIISKLK